MCMAFGGALWREMREITENDAGRHGLLPDWEAEVAREGTHVSTTLARVPMASKGVEPVASRL